jgi:hypothetical protein
MSSFQKYTDGVRPVTGMSEAGANIGKMYQQGLSQLGAGIAEGLKIYNENSEKSEAANAKIQMLGQAYADKIAMYSKDPEIAQSGILDGLMVTAKMIQEAPTKGLSQRVMLVHEAETKLSGFGNQLQEWSFLRGREMERNAEEALRKFAGFKSVTQAAFVGDAEFQVDLNLTPQEAQAQALAKLGRIRKSNPNLQGTDEEFLSAWRTAREQALANAKDVNPSVVSAGLEALAAEKRNAKAQADAQKKNDISGMLSSKFWSTEAPAVGGALNLPSLAQSADEQPQFLAPVGKTVASMKDYGKTVVSPVEQVYRNENPKKVPTAMDAELAQIAATASENVKRLEARKTELLAKQKEEEKRSYFRQSAPIERTAENIGELLRNYGLSIREEYSKVDSKTGDVSLDKGKIVKTLLQRGYASATMPYTILDQLGAFDNKSQYEKDIIKSELARQEVAKGTAPIKTQIELIDKDIAAQKSVAKGVSKATEQEKPRQTVAPIPLQGFQIGTEEKQKRITVAERQREVADFVTSRMGAIDPTDPERKRRLPVAGFDKFYKSLVPESEIREFTTDSGIRMLYANGKWEQIKSAEPMTLQDIRKSKVGIYGQQNDRGGFTPTEFVPDSGVYIGGIFTGGDAANDKYGDEMTQLIDARRSVKELQRINDLVGESLMPVEQGRALVEQMNLSAMLRTDIVGVGTVSNYEQQLIAKVIKDPTAFFSFESKDRAILVALSQRVDRRIKAISASKGLTVQIRDDSGSSKYQALREQYLREKGIL